MFLLTAAMLNDLFENHYNCKNYSYQTLQRRLLTTIPAFDLSVPKSYSYRFLYRQFLHL